MIRHQYDEHALLHLGIDDKEVQVALLAVWSRGHQFDKLKLHAGFPEEVKRILPELVDFLGEGEESLLTLVAHRLAEVGPGASSALAALREARGKLVEQRQYWAENPIDSGGSHQRRVEIAEALDALDAAITSGSSASRPSPTSASPTGVSAPGSTGRKRPA